MIYSISDLLTWRDCPYKAHALLTAGLSGRTTQALSVGTALHKHMEWILKGRSGSAPEPESDEIREELTPLTNAVAAWSPPFQVLSVERAFTTKVGTETWGGTLDALVEDSDGRWSLQWKTIAKGRRLDLELERVRMSLHELWYHHLAGLYGYDLKGTILGTFRKLTKKDHEAGLPVFALHKLRRSPDEVAQAIKYDILPLIGAFHNANLAGARDWSACLGHYGNSPCPLYHHCHDGVPLVACGLQQREERYGQDGSAAGAPDQADGSA